MAKKENFEQRLLLENMIDISSKGVMKKMFKFDDDYNLLKNEERWGHFDGALLPMNVLMYGDKELHKGTIKENKKMLEDFLDRCREYKIKVIFTLLPRYHIMEHLLKIYYDKWLNPFQNYMHYLSNKYGVMFIDYKDRLEISGNKHFYSDAEHLNTAGAYAMTSILVKEIVDSKV